MKMTNKRDDFIFKNYSRTNLKNSEARKETETTPSYRI